MAEKANKKEMVKEAIKMLQLLGVRDEDIKQYKKGDIPSVFVDYKERKIQEFSLGQKEEKIISDLEKDGNWLVYYAIHDIGRWSDGRMFMKWTFLTVSCYKDDWKICEESIVKFKCVPSYVYNCLEPENSEYVEVPFKNKEGFLISVG